MSKLIATMAFVIASIIAISIVAAAEGYYSQKIIGYSESKIVVLPSEDQEPVVECYGLNRIEAQSLDVKGTSVKELLDNTIKAIVIKKAVNVGSQVTIEGTLADDCPLPNYPVVAIFEVRDSNGFTTYLAWQNMTMNQHEQATVGVSWIPVKGGDHTVRLFAYYCPNCLGILGHVASIPVSVITDK